MEPLEPSNAAQLEALLHQLQSLKLTGAQSGYGQSLQAFADATQSQLNALRSGESLQQHHISGSQSENQQQDMGYSAPTRETDGIVRSAPGTSASDRDCVSVNSSTVPLVYSSSDEPRQYGITDKGSRPLKPPLNAFTWPVESLSKQPKPSDDILNPADPVQERPEAGEYPHTPPYRINEALDPVYRRGWRYAAPYHYSSKERDKQRMLNIQLPPNITPTAFDKVSRRFISEPIPGMVRMPLGIPMVHHINGDPNMAVTVACAHSLKTLEMYDEGQEIAELMPRLLELTWGVAETADAPGSPAIFELPGLQVNLRSEQLSSDRLNNGEGSFNLASTHGEGEGAGHFGPAVQTNAPAEAEHIAEVLRILHRLYRLIMPLCISRFEWELMEFVGLDNNVVAFGGLDPGPTSCQLNSSAAATIYNFDFCAADMPAVSLSGLDASGSGSHESQWLNLREHIHAANVQIRALRDAIGPQGRPHGDFQDDWLWFTLFVLLLRLPKGSDMGPFMFLRPALYLRESDEYVVFASFKANDIHSGTAPTYVKQMKDSMVSMEDADKLFKKYGPHVRCGYVLYPSFTATTRSTQVLYTRSLRFLYTPADPRADSRRYYASHGQTVLGDHRSRFNRFGQEGVLGFKNFLAQCGLTSTLSTDALLASLTFRDERGSTRTLEPAPFNIDDDDEYRMMSVYRGYYAYWRDILALYPLGLTHSTFTAQQAKISRRLAETTERPDGIPKERNLVVLRSALSRGSFQTVEHILGRHKQGSEIIWSVLVTGSSEIRNVPQETWWLHQGENAKKCLAYYSDSNASVPLGRSSAEQNNTNAAAITSSPNAITGTALDNASDNCVSPSTTLLDGVHGRGDQHNRGRKRRRQTPVYSSDSSESEPEDSASQLTAPEDGGICPADESTAAPMSSADQYTTPNDSASEFTVPEDTTVNSAGQSTTTPTASEGVQSDEYFPESDSDSEDGAPEQTKANEFTVEEIIDTRFKDGERQWLVKWEGYPASDNSWLRDEDFGHPAPMLESFRRKLGLDKDPDVVMHPPTSDDEDAAGTRKRNSRRTRRVIDEILEEDIAPEIDLEFLRRLLDVPSLKSECAQVADLIGALAKPKQLSSINVTPHEIATRILSQIEQQNDISFQLEFALTPEAGWSSHLAKLMMACVENIGTSLAGLTLHSEVGDLVQRGAQAQICRCLVAAYQWLVHLGPSLAKQLIQTLESQGERILKEQFPELAGMVIHVVGFIRDCQTIRMRDAAATRKEANKRKRDRREGSGSTRRGQKRKFPAPAPNTIDSGPAAQSLTSLKESQYARVPADLWGLLPSKRGASMALENVPRNVSLQTNEDVYSVAARWLSNLWDKCLLLAPMQQLDKLLSGEKAKDDLVAVRARCITRGSILLHLADAVGEGIFFAREMYQFLRRPCRMFPSSIGRDPAFASSVIRNEANTFQNLDYHLAGWMAEGEIGDATQKLGDAVHRGLLTLQLGIVISDENWDDPAALLMPSALTKIANSTSRTRSLKQKVDTPTTTASLLPERPSLGVGAIIIRAALEEKRESMRADPPTQETRDAMYRRLLRGENGFTGYKQLHYDPDQMNPIRANLQGFHFLKSLIPPSSLTTAAGISSLLVFMSTGQGFATGRFLARMQLRQEGMVFRTLEEAVLTFEAEETMRAALPPDPTYKFHNATIYGQASNHYGLHPTVGSRKLSVREKFVPMFSDKVVRSYLALLGDLAGQDPTNLDAPRILWVAAQQWVVDTRINGFGAGSLGALQFANNLTLLGIAQPPSATEMAEWICSHQDKGAFRGLQVLGFNLADKNASPSAIRAAFLCFYAWLDHFLTDDDKIVLGTRTAKKDLSKLAADEFEGARWISGENLTEFDKWPFPPCTDYEPSVFSKIIEDK
ncbi:hypothetical protein FB45DRAFT_1039951 [Roridomyces roridus]|uniref:Chromo domain-containing protein n=1 Tax=Roridomyces roridus TaxID=1738132 RepID=A0AAD7B2H8_9AGAR|nr:hypothetical protein FB45DRAFT_1039951 [Roridomyces roridus]